MFKVTTYYTPDESSVQNYKMAWSKAWIDHVVYARNTIISLLGNLSDIEEVSNRLMKNQETIANLLRPYYDSATVDQLLTLLKTHATIAIKIVPAAQLNSGTKELITQWNLNCEEIVNCLEGMNPNWVQSNLEILWEEQLSLTINEIQFRLDKNWSSDIMNFDNITNNAYMIADCMSQGVVQQNMIKFCTQTNGGSHELTV
jgi:hypothetical protein